MSCSRGKASPDRQTQLRLFADSGGYCQKPDCLRPLFVEASGIQLHIAEMAHILAAANDGPRAQIELSEEARGAYANLVLLCPSCHTIIDKAPDAYPDYVVQEWKRQHRERIAAAFGAVEYRDRRGAREAISPLLAQNRAVFLGWGPDQDYRMNPESELADVWRRKVLSIILPNNRRILTILDSNRPHLSTQEIDVVEKFRQHVDDLEQRHLGTGPMAVGSRFPAGLDSVLTDP